MTAPPTGPAPAAGLTGRRHRWLRIAAGVVSVAVVLSSAVAWAGVSRYSGKITRIEIQGLTPVVEAPVQGHTPPMTLLVVASDSRDGLSRTETGTLHLGQANYGPPRTDTMMLVHIGADAGDITVVSLPRDTLATVPEYTDDKGKIHAAHRAKLNSAYEGGAGVMVQAIEQMTGVTINHYLEINFNGFLRMVDALGGVEVCLVKKLKDEKSGLDLPAGLQTISGPQALAYVRARYVDPTADLDRMKRQQKFVASIVKKATSAGTLLNPLKLDGFLSAVAGSITTDAGLGRDQLLALADQLKGLDPSRVAFMTVPLLGNKRITGIGDVLLWDEVQAKVLFDAINSDTPILPPSPSASASPSPSPSPSPSDTVAVAPSSVRIKVVNGTTTGGLGGKAAADLAAVGFIVVGKATTASAPIGATTVIRYDPGFDQSALTVAAALPGSVLTEVPGLGRTITVTIGTSYTGAQQVTVATPTKSASPTATPSPSATLPRTAADDLCA
ncbi:MAG: LytR family transcriptional regulator [Actinobacteria bacterium]|nr:LytR family transcriptional regulator [Actinomycetota bacterium]